MPLANHFAKLLGIEEMINLFLQHPVTFAGFLDQSLPVNNGDRPAPGANQPGFIQPGQHSAHSGTARADHGR